MKFIYTLVLGLFFLSFSACEKCVTCQQISASNDSLSFKYPETCGSEDDIIDYQDRLEQNKPQQNKVECTEKKNRIWD
jgi:hypothetical protein